jgi:hypothetical protein
VSLVGAGVDLLLNSSKICDVKLGSPAACQGPFCSPTEDGYLGVRFKLDDKAFYGWIHYAGSGSGNAGTVIDWAYEDTGGPIRAGQKPAPVPTFTKLGMYLFAALLIAGGVLKMRAKKEAS